MVREFNKCRPEYVPSWRRDLRSSLTSTNDPGGSRPGLDNTKAIPNRSKTWFLVQLKAPDRGRQPQDGLRRSPALHDCFKRLGLPPRGFSRGSGGPKPRTPNKAKAKLLLGAFFPGRGGGSSNCSA